MQLVEIANIEILINEERKCLILVNSKSNGMRTIYPCALNKIQLKFLQNQKILNINLGTTTKMNQKFCNILVIIFRHNSAALVAFAEVGKFMNHTGLVWYSPSTVC